MIPFGNKTVTAVQRVAGAKDKMGVPTVTTVNTTVYGCSLQSAAPPVEQLSNIDLTISIWKLFTPPGLGLKATDAFIIDGLTYEILGDPQVWPDPVTGLDDHTEYWLRRANG